MSKHMDPDDVLYVIEAQLLKRKLNPAERVVLGQTWSKQTYEQMAEHSGYGDAHLKDTGYKLWREMSQALGQRITKKSLLFVLGEYIRQRPDSLSRQVSQSPRFAYSTAGPAVVPLQYPAGPLPLNSPLYIGRPPNEDIAHLEIQRPGGFLRIKAPQKMGKTSLVFRLIQRAQQQGYKTAYVDLQLVDEAVFVNTETFLRWFCLKVGQELNLLPKLEEYWDSSMGYKVSSECYFQEYLLEHCTAPMVLFISAAETLIQHPEVAQEFFPLLRYWHEKARWNSTWQNLRISIAHATEIYIPLKIHQSPFNIGQAIKLPNFTPGQVSELAARYGVKNFDEHDTQELMDLVGGHPYLTNVFFYHLMSQMRPLKALVSTAATPSGIYGTHLRNYLALLQREPDLAIALKRVVSHPGGIELDAITLYRLESLGLIQIRGYQAIPSCEVCRRYFLQQLNLEEKPAS